MILVPDYYKEFKCIGGRCRHTCCAGWEIDIDSESLARYERDGIPNIVPAESKNELSHFALDEKLRCAFLREDNLCRLIIDRGEDYLCQICRDHPRFRNFWTGITETGLGLSCEEAARIILLREEPLRLVSLEDPGYPGAVEAAIGRLPEDESSLWDIRQDMLDEASALHDRFQARLAEYLIFRQIPDALYDGLLEERMRFVWDSVNEVTDLWDASEDQSDEALVEIARKWSEALEYNPSALRERLTKY